MKKEYVAPDMELLVLEQDDVITSSPIGIGTGGVGNQQNVGNRDVFGDWT